MKHLLRVIKEGDWLIPGPGRTQYHWWTEGKAYQVQPAPPGGRLHVIANDGDTYSSLTYDFTLVDTKVTIRASGRRY